VGQFLDIQAIPDGIGTVDAQMHQTATIYLPGEI